MNNPRSIAISIAVAGLALLVYSGAAALFPDVLLAPAYGIAPALIALLGLTSSVLAATFLIFMCFPWHRSPLALWLGLAWLTPLFIVLGWAGSIWIPIVIASPACVLFCIGLMQREGTRTSNCAECGYNLTGLRAGTICPECGRGRA